MQRIKNVKELRQSLEKGQREFRVLLGGGIIYSRKTISPLPDGRFRILNHIDNSIQKLTGRQLYARSITVIGEAMQKGAFLAETP